LRRNGIRRDVAERIGTTFVKPMEVVVALVEHGSLVRAAEIQI
jgi:hypothetical protein